MTQTIYALATPLGNGVAIIRLSGPDSERALRAIFSRKGSYESHKLYHGILHDQGEPVDDAMAVLMRAPNSYTGEDVVELHIHGSPAIANRTMAMLSALGLRLAGRGEFTRRAFENGKLDLSQAEAVMDLVCACAKTDAKVALSQLTGSLSQVVTDIQSVITDAIARAEAGIDYPEEDWETEIADELLPILAIEEKRVQRLIDGGVQGRLLRDGLKVALCGRPNVGKSTLLNALLGQHRAIVTDIPGTTRDTIEERMDWNGLPVCLIDTAGIREASDAVEQIGVERARAALEQADLILALFDGSAALSEEDGEILAAIGHKKTLAVITKGDLPQQLTTDAVSAATGLEAVCVCAHQEGGLDALKAAVSRYFESLAPAELPDATVTNRRHLDALEVAREGLAAASAALRSSQLDCATIDLRRAWRALGEISGQTIDECIVDRIFARFCLGK